MKKLLVAFDGSFYSESALRYAIQLARSANAIISGIFLEDLTAYHQFSPVFHAPEMIGIADEVLVELKNENRQNISDNIERFSKTCSEHNVPYEIERESGIPSRELIEETRYVDLILTGSVTYFSNISYASDHNLISDLLTQSHCPVIVVPEEYYEIKSAVLAFDGSASSIFAIKWYVYLFQDFIRDQSITLLSVLKDEKGQIEGERRLHNYLKLIHPGCKYEKVTGKPVDEILHFAKVAGNSILVMGSHGRSAFSKLFKASIGEKIVKSKTVPVFVAHE